MPEKKETTAKKAPTKKRAAKGDRYACEVCGMVVTVDQIGDYIEYNESPVVCCGKEMKPKKVAAKKA